MIKIATIIVLLIGLCSSQCDQQNTVTDQSSSSISTQLTNDRPSRWQLYSAYGNNEIIVIYGSNEEHISTKYEAAIKAFKQRISAADQQQLKIRFEEASSVDLGDIKDKIVYIVGTPMSVPLIEYIKQGLPIGIESRGITILDKIYTDEHAVLAMYNYPNPQQSNLPLTLITGNNDEAVYEVFEQSLQSGVQFTWASFDYVVYSNSAKTAIGAFDNKWEIKPDLLFEFGDNDVQILKTTNYSITNYNTQLGADELNRIGQRLEDRVASIKEFVGSQADLSHMSYHIYPSAEKKALHQSNSAQSHVNFEENICYTIINELYEKNYIEKENQLVLRSLLGKPYTSILELGLGIQFTDQWQREGYQYWAARLVDSGYRMSLSELFNQEPHDRKSTLLIESMSGVLIDFLVNLVGKKQFLERYKSWTPSSKDIEELSPSWQKYLSDLPNTHPIKDRSMKKVSYLQGFNFAHEGYRIFNGYLSNLASEAIYKQAELGANAMAIVPYSYMNAPNKPNALSIPNRPGQENDQGVIHSAYVAKQQGMTTMLKPQIWFRGSWPGDVDMKSDEDWDLFFKYYNDWIIHYALLAEIHEIDMLSIGVEFVKATLSHEEEWRQIIRNVRNVYQGQLTYSANWGDEFEKVGFWDELDFIGLNCYYPLSKQDSPSKRELRKNFEGIKNKIKKVYRVHQKPIVFTEIGFRSIDAPWKNPHAEGDDSFNAAHQDLCYQVIFEGIQDQEWCGGILWWKFPSYLDYQGAENSSFTPNMKQAEGTIRDWFSKN